MRYKLVKSAIAIGAFMVSYGMAADDVEVKNMCDTLSSKVTLVLDHVDESVWITDYDFSNVRNAASSQKRIGDVHPQEYAKAEKIPLLVEASCKETTGNRFSYATSESGLWKVYEGDEVPAYATQIADIRRLSVGNFNESNTYNILMMSEGEMPSDGSFGSSQLLPSREYDFGFEWWYASAIYKTVEVKVEIKGSDTLTTTNTKYSSSYALGNDSLTVLNKVKKSGVSSDVSEVKFQVWKGLLVDSTKIEGDWKDYFNETSSSSSQPESSSSSDDPSGIYELRQPKVVNRDPVQMRRLDGSFVRRDAMLAPGIYYVKQKNGSWKKQLILQR